MLSTKAMLAAGLVSSVLADDTKPTTVHIVPQSHDDVGWLKTLDEYFDGDAKDIQWTSVDQTI